MTNCRLTCDFLMFETEGSGWLKGTELVHHGRGVSELYLGTSRILDNTSTRGALTDAAGLTMALQEFNLPNVRAPQDWPPLTLRHIALALWDHEAVLCATGQL